MPSNTEPSSPPSPGDAAHNVTFREALKVWIKVALLSFGGPAGQIAVMHKLLVEEKKWVSENRFLHALNYCMLLPGPEAQQLATYIGWLLHRTAGGLVAGTLFILPGFISILALSILYAGYQDAMIVQALFYGLKPAVMAVVIEAVIRIGRRALKNQVMVTLAATAFVAIFFFNVPFPVIVITAAMVGLLGGKLWPAKFHIIKQHATTSDDSIALRDDAAIHARPTLGRTLRVAAVWLTLWFVPLIALLLWRGPQSIYALQATFFSKMSVVTFGGAYAALAYMAQRAVEVYGWLKPGEMLDGLGMAETTPGPLIQVVQFIGFMGAYREAWPINPWVAGVLGSVIATWFTFVPCFMWIFLGAPYIEHLRGNKNLSSALSGITAAVVGVILNLAVWFALHSLFAQVNDVYHGPLKLHVPVWSTIDWFSIAIAALLAMLRFRINMLLTLATSAATGLLLFLLFK